MDNPSTAIGVGLVIVVIGVLMAALVLLVVNLSGKRKARTPESRIPILCDAPSCLRRIVVPADIFHDAQAITEHSTLTGAGWTAVPRRAGRNAYVATYCPLHSVDPVTS